MGLAAQQAAVAAERREAREEAERAALYRAREAERERLAARSADSKNADVMAALGNYEMVRVEGGAVLTDKGTGLTVDHDFYIGKFEVTAALAKAVTNEAGEAGNPL